MVQETLQPGASVAIIARRHGVNANQLFSCGSDSFPCRPRTVASQEADVHRSRHRLEAFQCFLHKRELNFTLQGLPLFRRSDADPADTPEIAPILHR
jgi:transposase-like protein